MCFRKTRVTSFMLRDLSIKRTTRIDKECKLVALNKGDYINGLMKVLGDSSKFSKYQAPPRGRGRPSEIKKLMS